MSEVPLSVFSAALQAATNSSGTKDLGIVLIDALKAESLESVGNSLAQLERSEHGVVAFARSPSLPAALQAVIDSRNKRILGLLLEIILKSRTLSTDSLLVEMDGTGKLFEKVLPLISSEDLSVSEGACKLTESIICSSHERHEVLLNAMFLESSRYADTDKNLYLRYANIWARILGKDDVLFNSCDRCGAAAATVSLCQSNDDILVQIVAMELLTEFSKTACGFQYLLARGIVDWLAAVASSEEGSSLLGSQALRQLGDLFATAASKHLMTGEVWSAIDKGLIGRYLTAARTFLESRSEANRLTGLYGLSCFASSCEGALEIVLNDSALLEEWLTLLNSGKAEILVAALYSVARVLDMEAIEGGGGGQGTAMAGVEAYKEASESKASSSTEGVAVPSSAGLATLKKRLVSEMGKIKGGPVVLSLMKTARQPVIERKIAVYAVMTSLCQQQPGGWGLMALYSAPGFREFIEDRNTEHSKEGKDAKFSLIKAVSESPQFNSLISEDISSAVHKMVTRGAYFKAAAMEDPMVLEL